ncbi:MAG: efflux RND transporter periplasmic adaptor subunit, partial [Planctomycetota bacterium]
TLRTGITAKAEIAIGEMKNVVYVPLQTVQVKDGKHRCFVKARGAVQPREVEIGRSNDDYVEIKKGLDEGEVVLLYDPSGEGAEHGSPAASNAPR